MKQFRVRCTAMEGGYVDPDLIEIYNEEDPTEWYPAVTKQFRINEVITESDFFLTPFNYGDEVWMIANRNRRK